MTAEFDAQCGIHWTWDDIEYRYQVGRISQDEFEALGALHPLKARGFGPPYFAPGVPPLICRIADTYAEHHGRPLSYPSEVVTNIQAARDFMSNERLSDTCPEV